MKRVLRAVLIKLGLEKLAIRLWNDVKSLMPGLLWQEIRLRLPGRRTSTPFPPSRLIYLVMASDSRAAFYESGKVITGDLRSQLEAKGIEIGAFSTILDFGCGCGRLIRHFRDLPAKLFGCDYNRELITWCQRKLSFARFEVNGLRPPLPYEAGSFDFVYARSVLTHLDLELQLLWQKEFCRVLASGGILYFSIHGDRFLSGLAPEQVEAYRGGRLVVTRSEALGENICGAYESPRFVEEHLLEGFSLVAHIPGRDHLHLKQDIYLLSKRSIS